MAPATYQVDVELLGHDGRAVSPVQRVELTGRSVWQAVGGLRDHLAHAPWCSALAFRVVGVEGPDAAELRLARAWASLRP